MKEFKVIECPNCGNIQSSQTVTVFKCFRCGKSKTYNPKSKLGLGVKVLATFGLGEEAARFIQEYTKNRWERDKNG